MIKRSNLPAGERDKNIAAVLDCLATQEETSLQDIVARTGVSTATASRVINSLVSKGLAITTGKEITESGRRPNIFRLNGAYGYMVFFHMRSDRISGAIAGIDGNILADMDLPISWDLPFLKLVLSFGKIYEELIAMAGVKRSAVLVALVSLPGIIDAQTNTVRRTPNICTFKDENVQAYIEEVLQVHVILVNDARLCTVGEHHSYYPAIRNMVYIYISDAYGIGAGIIMDGELYEGSRGAAGEIGESFFDLFNFIDSDVSQMGTTERYASLQAIYRRIGTLLQSGRATILKQLMGRTNTGTLSLDLIEQAITLGDQDVNDIYDAAVRIWSIAFINLFALLDPELLVVGGEITQECSVTLEKLRRHIARGLYYEPDIRLGMLGEKASRNGGIYMLQQYVLENILVYDAIK